MFAQSLQDELVVHETLDGLEQEGVEWQVADLLQFKLFVNGLQLLQPLGSLLQLCQHLVVLLQVAGEPLTTDKAARVRSGAARLIREAGPKTKKTNKNKKTTPSPPSARTCSSASRRRSSGSRL